MRGPQFDLRCISMQYVRDLCARHHGYASAGNASVYAFGVVEDERLVAAYAWQPPPPGAARVVCPEAPHAVLALSRMVAVPKTERRLQHVSKPLRWQMRNAIDRTRWPVLVTYSDEGEGHTGHVYKCSGWKATSRARRPVYEDAQGRRVSSYANGASGARGFARSGWTVVQRWEQRVAGVDDAGHWLRHWGWRAQALSKQWRSGAQAQRWVRVWHDFGFCPDCAGLVNLPLELRPRVLPFWAPPG